MESGIQGTVIFIIKWLLEPGRIFYFDVSNKVHFILSDWMGDCLFSRSRLLGLLHARDKYLADSGLLLPDKAALYLAAVTAPYDILDFWNENVCGYDMGCAKPLAVQGGTRGRVFRP